MVFVEKARKALLALRANIDDTGLGGTVIEAPVERVLDSGWGPETLFHVVFMDPPWDQPTGVMEQQLSTLDQFLALEGEVVVSRRHTDTEPRIPENWRVAANKRYGDTRILRYTKADPRKDGEL